MSYVVKASKFIQLSNEERKKLVGSGKFIPVNDKFFEYFGSRDSVVFLYGSYGNGKSKFVCQDLVEKCRTDKYFKCFYGRKIFDRVRSTIYDEMVTEIEERGLSNEFNYSRADNSTMIITHKTTGNKFIPFGGDKPDSLKGIKDPSHILCDELDQFQEKDFGFLFSRLRKEDVKTQFYGLFNTEPLIEGHWLRKMLETDIMPITKVFGVYRENYFLNIEEYEKKLRLIANGREHIFESIANGKFGVIFNENPFFYALDRTKHYIDERYLLEENEELYLSFDFNKNPVTLVVSSIKNKHLHIIELITTNEYTIDGLTPLEASCKIFFDKYIASGLIHPAYLQITGDASGAHGGADKKAKNNFYTTIQNSLHISEYQIKKRKMNITHQLSQEICNTFLYSCNFTIYKSARLVLEDMERSQMKDGSILKDNKNPNHFTDSIRYLIDRILNFDKWKDYILYYKHNKI